MTKGRRVDSFWVFPQTMRVPENYMDENGYGRCRTVSIQVGGMSLRDYFAAAALQGIEASQGNGGEFIVDFETIAARSYGIADAMLAEREKEAP